MEISNVGRLCFIHRTSHLLNLMHKLQYNIFSLLWLQTIDIVKMNLVRLFKFNAWINRRTYFIYWVNKVHLLLRLVFTSNGITVRIISIDVKALMTLWKSKIGVISALDQSRRNQNVSIFFRLCLWLSNWRSSENQIVGFGSRSVRILTSHNACSHAL